MEIVVKEYVNKKEMYLDICEQFKLITEKGEDLTALLANASALLKQFLDETNWVGFYIWKKDRLILGPFQGKTAVTSIALGAGVCGTAVLEKKIQRVDDVHSCCNHIACDFASASEIVVPVWKNGEIFGVIDIDSPIQARFDKEDEEGLEKFAVLLSEYLVIY